MKHENISDAMNLIDDGLIAETSAVRANAKTRKSRFPKLAAVAAAIALAVCGTTAIAAIGGRFIEVKNRQGAIVGGQYVNATNEIKVSAMSDKSGGVSISSEVIDPSQPPFSAFDSFRIYTYTITDEHGKTIAKCSDEYSSEDGEPRQSIYLPEPINIQIENPEDFNGDLTPFLEEAGIDLPIELLILKFDDNGGAHLHVFDPSLSSYEEEMSDGGYSILFLKDYEGKPLTLHINSFIGESKADQPLEIHGDWAVEFTIVEPQSESSYGDSGLHLQALKNESGGLTLDITVDADSPYSDYDVIRPSVLSITDEDGNFIGANGEFKELHYAKLTDEAFAEIRKSQENVSADGSDPVGFKFDGSQIIELATVYYNDEGEVYVVVLDESFDIDCLFGTSIPTELVGKELTLHVHSFIGEKEGEEPTEIFGDWETGLVL